MTRETNLLSPEAMARMVTESLDCGVAPSEEPFRITVLCPEGYEVPEGTDCAHGCPHPECPTCPGRTP
jgi:hypothetical protein